MGAVDRFMQDTSLRSQAAAPFARASEAALAVHAAGGVWLKPGATIAHTGHITFARRATLDGLLAGDAISRETAPFVEAIGEGRVYCAHRGRRVHVLDLVDEALVVTWDGILAFEQRLQFAVGLLGGALGLAAGGIVGVRFGGTGAIALATHGQPLVIPVSPGQPVHTDPHATVAWTATLEPILETDVTWRSVVGHGGHEPIQMRFEGEGHVVVQPFEEPAQLAGTLRSARRVAALLAG